MFKTLLSAAVLAAMAATPAFAQDVEETLEEAATPAPRAAATYAQIDYSLQADRENILLLDLSTGRRVAIRLMPDWAPNHVERIKTLTRQGFYDGVVFHRVIDGFMAQTGDPTGTGQGGSELPDLEEEFNPMPHVRGTVSMARARTEDSANSQFFIVFYPRFSLDRTYTNFGRVISGMDAVDGIARGEPPGNPTRIVQASLASDNAQPPSPAELAQPQTGAREITADDLNAPLED
ncbi:peptidylprolyl isomerase [Alteriqipengyuania lutimaris]|uniref:Peptidyl-prolyl cis-trans isomerase n=1 Tax=Alteriqipengyuania lutimaris TaxID=1538146 RepID=A0A395LQU4_9SPHN|nr:peptidylprolyl isomerase [Alteriqipengyuania lutimaris]MBB3033000.1 peptidylprolyl isomerase [Alteriqipengyuania lutimaris]RDS77924.1 peptidylprolyl isomerase [Alteriqipengyuania lutimaris]